MRILCWNLQHRVAAWDRVVELVNEHQVDVALLQEAGRPKGAVVDALATWPLADENWHTLDRPDSVGRRWCAALAWPRSGQAVIETEVRTKLAEANWDVPTISHPGQFAVGRVTMETGEQVTLVSLYGIWDTQPGKSWIFADATLHRAVSDLTPVLQSGEKVIIGGDLNILYGYGALDKWTIRANTVFERLSTFGVEVVGPFREEGTVLEGCACKLDGCRHVSTRPDPSGRPWQLDWILSNMSAERFTSAVLPMEDVSDHTPVLVEVDLSGRFGAPSAPT